MAKYATTKVVEQNFARQLRRVARIIGGIIESHVVGSTIVAPEALKDALEKYSAALGPWAERVTAEMLKSVSYTNLKAWQSSSKAIGQGLSSIVSQSSTGAVARMLQREQVTLIKSLPIDAGIRAQDLAMSAVTGGRRADEVAKELMRSGEVTESRATLIARTEVAKSNAAITQARAAEAGVSSYIWRTAEDGDVRESHAEMEGTIHNFNAPPTLSDGMTGNPGEFPNCRCFAEPIIPGA